MPQPPVPCEPGTVNARVSFAVEGEAVCRAGPIHLKPCDHPRIVDTRRLRELRAGRRDIGVSSAGVKETDAISAAVHAVANDVTFVLIPKAVVVPAWTFGSSIFVITPFFESSPWVAPPPSVYTPAIAWLLLMA